MQSGSVRQKSHSDELTFTGLVVTGNQLGRTIGFRTANIGVPTIDPQLYGIYTTTVRLTDGRVCSGVSNLGIKPTVGSKYPLLESHIFDFDEDIYGQTITVTLHAKLRPEKRFESIDALKAQLNLDIQTARNMMRTDKISTTS